MRYAPVTDAYAPEWPTMIQPPTSKAKAVLVIAVAAVLTLGAWGALAWQRGSFRSDGSAAHVNSVTPAPVRRDPAPIRTKDPIQERTSTIRNATELRSWEGTYVAPIEDEKWTETATAQLVIAEPDAFDGTTLKATKRVCRKELLEDERCDAGTQFDARHCDTGAFCLYLPGTMQKVDSLDMIHGSLNMGWGGGRISVTKDDSL